MHPLIQFPTRHKELCNRAMWALVVHRLQACAGVARGPGNAVSRLSWTHHTVHEGVSLNSEELVRWVCVCI